MPKEKHTIFKKKTRNIKTVFFGMSTGAFWHVDGRILACQRTHFEMSTDAFWHVDGRGSFWHVDGRSFHVHESIYYFSLYCSSCPSYFLASRGVALAYRRTQFSCPRVDLLFFTLLFFLSQLLFGKSGSRLGISTGAVFMSTSRFTIFHFTILPVPATFWQVGGVALECR